MVTDVDHVAVIDVDRLAGRRCRGADGRALAEGWRVPDEAAPAAELRVVIVDGGKQDVGAMRSDCLQRRKRSPRSPMSPLPACIRRTPDWSAHERE